MQKSDRIVYRKSSNGNIVPAGKTQRYPTSSVNKNGGPIKAGTADKKNGQ